jgi:hypothetical protein
MRSFTTLTLVLLLCLALATPPSAAAELRSRDYRGGDLLPSLWSVLLSWWSFGKAPLTKEGCRLDPLGGCQEAAPTTEAGCRLDPLGGCQEAAPTTEEGVGIDPLG